MYILAYICICIDTGIICLLGFGCTFFSRRLHLETTAGMKSWPWLQLSDEAGLGWVWLWIPWEILHMGGPKAENPKAKDGVGLISNILNHIQTWNQSLHAAVEVWKRAIQDLRRRHQFQAVSAHRDDIFKHVFCVTYPLVIKHSYGKSPFIVDFPIKHGDFTHSYVKSPEGNPKNCGSGCSSSWVWWSQISQMLHVRNIWNSYLHVPKKAAQFCRWYSSNMVRI